MKSEHKVKIAGKDRVFSMPLGAIEEVAKVNDMARQLGTALATGYAKDSEVRAIVEASIAHSNVGLSYEEIWNELRQSGMERLAFDLWIVAWGDDSGNFLAARKILEKNRFAFGSGSSPVQ